MKLKSNIDAFFTKKPWVYGLVYILMIPVFAGVYYINPEGFYQSTVAQEGRLSPIKSKIESKLSGLLFNLLEHSGKERGIAYIDLNSLKIIDKSNSSLDKIDIYYYYTPVYVNRNRKIDYNSNNDLLRLYYRRVKGRSKDERVITPGGDLYLDAGDQKIHKLSYVRPDRLPGGEIMLSIIGPYKTEIIGLLKQYLMAKRGFGGSGLGEFGVMLYFSIVTITTLGYGDIVPLSAAARFLVSVESILGVILVGLFLNALSNKMKGRD